jgi:uncharacterized protein (DUF1330 family)
MIVLTQLVYIHPGKEEAYEKFEATVLPLLPQYGGELLLRLRPSWTSFVAGSREVPYEVHLVTFETKEGLARYSNDEVRQRCLHLKNESVRSSLVFEGTLA